MAITFESALKQMSVAGQMKVLHAMTDDLLHGRDETIAALRKHADEVGAQIVLVGGVAVICHGYPRPTKDRDVLVDFRSANALANRLMDDPDWERLEVRQYAFLHRPTGVPVDFLVSRDLMQLGSPYQFPDVDKLETDGEIENVPVIGLHGLLFLKLLAGRMRDLADLMELCKRHLDIVEADRVLAPLEQDDPLRTTFLDILSKAPLEIASERRLGQGNPENYRHLKDS
jgi:hypothetical protein